MAYTLLNDVNETVYGQSLFLTPACKCT